MIDTAFVARRGRSAARSCAGAGFEADQRRRLAEAEAYASQTRAEQRKQAEQLRANNQAFYALCAAADAQSATAAPALAMTVAWNTGAAHAYSMAASMAAFPPGCAPDPWPEGTDIGDG